MKKMTVSLLFVAFLVTACAGSPATRHPAASRAVSSTAAKPPKEGVPQSRLSMKQLNEVSRRFNLRYKLAGADNVSVYLPGGEKRGRLPGSPVAAASRVFGFVGTVFLSVVDFATGSPLEGMMEVFSEMTAE